MSKARGLPYNQYSIEGFKEHRKSRTMRLITRNNSIIPKGADWNKLDWNQSAVHINKLASFLEDASVINVAPAVRVDGTPEDGQYLHVPYNWAEDQTVFRVSPKFQVGDVIWSKEPWATNSFFDGIFGESLKELYYENKGVELIYQEETLDKRCYKWRSSRFAPRWASRFAYPITGILAERPMDLTEEEAIAEGFLSLADYLVGIQKIDGTDCLDKWMWVYEQDTSKNLAKAIK